MCVLGNGNEGGKRGSSAFRRVDVDDWIFITTGKNIAETLN